MKSRFFGYFYCRILYNFTSASSVLNFYTSITAHHCFYTNIIAHQSFPFILCMYEVPTGQTFIIQVLPTMRRWNSFISWIFSRFCSSSRIPAVLRSSSSFFPSAPALSIEYSSASTRRVSRAHTAWTSAFFEPF